MKALEGEAQGHLDLAGAADGFVDFAQTKRAIVEAIGWSIGVAARRQNLARGRGQREAVVILVLGDVVDRDVEAGGVEDVEHLKRVLEHEAFIELGELHNGNVHPLLPGLSEDVALAGGEAGFKGIVHRDGAAQSARRENWKREAGRIECVTVDAVLSGERGLWRAAGSQRDDDSDGFRWELLCKARRRNDQSD